MSRRGLLLAACGLATLAEVWLLAAEVLLRSIDGLEPCGS